MVTVADGLNARGGGDIGGDVCSEVVALSGVVGDGERDGVGAAVGVGVGVGGVSAVIGGAVAEVPAVVGDRAQESLELLASKATARSAWSVEAENDAVGDGVDRDRLGGRAGEAEVVGDGQDPTVYGPGLA